MTSALDSFLQPASIAVIGASADPHKLRGRLCEYLIQNGYPGELHFINPSHRSVFGRPCVPDISAVPGRVDLAIIVVPAIGVLAALEGCAAAGARNALILSSGFAEERGAQIDVQQQITAIARASGMRVCGPNAEGYHNEIGHISATFSPAVVLDPAQLFTAAPRRCGVIAQSGGIGFAIYHRGRALGLSFSRVVTVGNEADLTMADFLGHMVDDTETSSIILFVEEIRNAPAFLRAAERAAIARKPIVIVKVGRSAAGGRATASHTGSMAGWGAAYDAAFKRYGLIVVDDLSQALAAAAALTTCPLPKGRRAGVVTVSGGGGALMADALVAAGFELPELSVTTQTTIRGMIPSYGATQNPVDVTGQATRTGAPLKTIRLLAEGGEVDIVVAVTTMANTTRPPVDPAELRSIVEAQRTPILFFTYTVPSEFGLRSLAEAQSVTFTSASELAAAARALLEFGSFKLPEAVSPAPVPAGLTAGLAGVVPEYLAKDILARCGLPVQPRLLARSVADLADAAATVGFPVAAKIQSRDLPHKTEAGGVRLGLADAASLDAAYRDILAAAARFAPNAAIDGVLIEAMAPRGVEMIIGIVRDETFGPVLTVGAGGVHTELFEDVSRRLAPVSAGEAFAMLQELRSFPLLDGYRGAASCDVPALVDMIVMVSACAAGLGDRVREVELNPVIVHELGRGCSIVDAMIVIDTATAEAAAA